MIPVEVSLGTSRGQERTFSFRMVEDELFSPVLAYVSLALGAAVATSAPTAPRASASMRGSP